MNPVKVVFHSKCSECKAFAKTRRPRWYCKECGNPCAVVRVLEI